MMPTTGQDLDFAEYVALRRPALLRAAVAISGDVAHAPRTCCTPRSCGCCRAGRRSGTVVRRTPTSAAPCSTSTSRWCRQPVHRRERAAAEVPEPRGGGLEASIRDEVGLWDLVAGAAAPAAGHGGAALLRRALGPRDGVGARLLPGHRQVQHPPRAGATLRAMSSEPTWRSPADPHERSSTCPPRRPWLPADFVHPTFVEVPFGHHLRPIRADDVDLDMVAVMGSRERLWSIYGEAWGWPPATMTAEQDREDLARHAAEMVTHESFNYALFDADETALLGCVYIDPAGEARRRRRDLLVGRRRVRRHRPRGRARRAGPALGGRGLAAGAPALRRPGPHLGGVGGAARPAPADVTGPSQPALRQDTGSRHTLGA